MKIQFPLLFCFLFALILNTQSFAQANRDSVSEFKVTYFAADKTTELSKVNFDEIFYVKIIYPDGFERTSFNLHELNFMSGKNERRYSFSGLVIPYSIDSERSGHVFISFKFENDENIQATDKMMDRFEYDEDGNLILEAVLSSSSLRLPTGMNKLILKID